jgi:hypothetical protein
MLRLKRKPYFDYSKLETGDLALGYDTIDLIFNAGPFPDGGDCLFIRGDGETVVINSNDLIHDLDAYEIEQISFAG